MKNCFLKAQSLLDVVLMGALGVNSNCAPAPTPGQSTEGSGANADWQTYGNNSGVTRYSPVKQIDRSNLSQPSEPWTYQSESLL